ncbi:MAG: glycoside hydrolase [Flavobacteriales bacterium]|jgi:hypothetical protein|nr:glycoside hydrolase [Flavobacteriales bacterium]
MKILSYFTFVLFLFFSCAKQTANQLITDSNNNCSFENQGCQYSYTEMNGVSFENVSYAIDTTHVKPIKNINATWIATMPFAFIQNGDDSVQYNSNFQWYGETREGVIDIINLCHQEGLKVMLKPHIWAMGTWVGAINYQTEAEWQTFENSYMNYILDFAFVADSMEVEAFCIGVEMKQVVVNRPLFWNALIDSVRLVYSGPITYAANWDNYQNVTFWDQLDFIGIDAYFPVATQQTPSVEDCYNGWENDYDMIKDLCESINKKVVFTEFGYRNIDYTGQEPWTESSNTTFNNQAQENAYKALFCRFWGEAWFNGGFLWKWHPNHSNAGGNNNNRFTPQNKPVEVLISKVFEQTN